MKTTYRIHRMTMENYYKYMNGSNEYQYQDIMVDAEDAAAAEELARENGAYEVFTNKTMTAEAYQAEREAHWRQVEEWEKKWAAEKAAKAAKKAAKEAKKAAAAGMTVAEYKAEKAKAAKRARLEKDIAELENALAAKRAELAKLNA